MYSTLHKVKISHFLGRNLLTERFLPFKLGYILFKKLNFSRTLYRNGAPVKVLIKDGLGAMNFISDYERWLDEILSKLLKNDGTFLDIGANVGQTMIKVLSRFPHVRYLAIEPNKHCVKYLRALSEANNFKSVKILEYALSETEGEAELLTRYDDDVLQKVYEIRQ
jgi:tRNA G46 methylase TrmB